MLITGSEAVIKSLLAEGAEVIFGYPGGAIMPIYDALYDYKEQIRHILVRHEQGAVHAAEGYARMTGKPGVCFATSGPGATNLVTGLYDAMLDSIPIVAITGQVAENLLGTDAFQEADVIGITTPITKWNYQVTDPAEIPEVIKKAFYIANTGRPGPVLIDITKSAQFDKTEFYFSEKLAIKNLSAPQPNETAIKQAAEIINASKQPLMLVGHGVQIAHAEKAVQELAEKAQIPVAVTLHGLSSFPTNHPLYIGMLGMHGNYGPNKLTNEADVIIAIGMRFDDRVTGRLSDYAKQAKIIHIDIDPAEHNKNVPVTVAIHSDAKIAVEKLLKQLTKQEHKDWLNEFNKLAEEENKKVILSDIKPLSKQLKMAEVVNRLSELTRGKAVIVADVGQHQMTAARYYKFEKANSFITSGGAGTMGFALPAAIGAKVAEPNRDVIAVIGDGSFQMTIQELATIAQEKLPVKVIILNNNFLGMVRQWQEMFFEKRYSFVDMENPDFVEVAKGFHIDGQRVEKREELDSVLLTLLKSEKPYLLDIKVEKETNVFPMIPTGASVSEIRLE